MGDALKSRHVPKVVAKLSLVLAPVANSGSGVFWCSIV